MNLSISLDKKLYEQVKAAAESDHRTLSGFIQLALKNQIKEEEVFANRDAFFAVKRMDVRGHIRDINQMKRAVIDMVFHDEETGNEKPKNSLGTTIV